MQRLRGSLHAGCDDGAGGAGSTPFIGAARCSSDSGKAGREEENDGCARSAFSRGAAFGGGGGGVELPQFIRAVLEETGYEEVSLFYVPLHFMRVLLTI